jgi:hypothetical protein
MRSRRRGARGRRRRRRPDSGAVPAPSPPHPFPPPAAALSLPRWAFTMMTGLQLTAAAPQSWRDGGGLAGARRMRRRGDLGRPSIPIDDMYSGLCFVSASSVWPRGTARRRPLARRRAGRR